MTDYNKQREEKSIYAISFMLEFYGKDILRRFCRACREQECDVSNAFIIMKALLMQHLTFEQDYPVFEELAAMYARRMDMNMEDFAKLLDASEQSK
jgi:hypothetical protein